MGLPKTNCEVGALSETGYVREENQDRMSGIHVGLGQAYIVADGMGGHKGGAMAATLTVEGLQRHLNETAAGVDVEGAIKFAFEKTNKTVYERAHSGDSETEEMGSTAVLFLISGRVARVAHVGDSRAYLYRKGELRPLTKDHTKVQKMMDAGMLTAEEARDHPDASVLDRAIGNQPDIDVDIGPILELKDGDSILLCSDGLSGYADDADIESVLRSDSTVQEIPGDLFALALEKGSDDNVTIQYIQYGERSDVRAPQHTRRLWYGVATILGVVMLGAVVWQTMDSGNDSEPHSNEERTAQEPPPVPEKIVVDEDRDPSAASADGESAESAITLRLEEATTKINKLEIKLSIVEKEKQGVDAVLTTLKRKLEKKKEELLETNNRVNALNAVNTDQLSTINDLMQQNGELAAKIAAKKKEIEQLSAPPATKEVLVLEKDNPKQDESAELPKTNATKASGAKTPETPSKGSGRPAN